jgi:tetratricopeptide (TPR) repeat protein
VTSLGLVVIAVVTVPALGLVLWPLIRRGRSIPAAPAAAAGETRLELLEEKAAAYRALKELAFDYEAGHLSEDDYAALRERYESRAAEVLATLDALGPAAAETAPRPELAPVGAAPAPAGFSRHPIALVAGAVIILVFGVVVGLNVGRFTESTSPMTPSGSRPLGADSPGAGGPVGPPTIALEPGKPVPPGILAGMLSAARQSLMDGHYAEAIAAYQAVLKREPRNVDAMTHLGLIVAIGGHADSALETFDKASRIDPSYPPIYLYRGQVLYEVKQDYPGAVQAWQRFLALVPSGDEHQRVAALVKEAQDKQRAR